MPLIANIIGAGNLGKTLGFLLARSKGIRIGCVYNTTIESSINAIDFIGQGSFVSKIQDLPAADITFITTPDSSISKACEIISRTGLKNGSMVIHCSGALTSEILYSAKAVGCFTASVHPMRSFANPGLSISQYEGTYCAIEGDDEIMDDIETLFRSIGSITYKICKEKKSSYHAAGVFASNYLVTLSHHALTCMKDAGVEEEMAMRVITNIMQGTINNLESTLSPKDSLTGPIKRGDILTVKKHIDSFENIEQKQLYSILGLSTIPITSLNFDQKSELVSMLSLDNQDEEIYSKKESRI